MNTSLEQSEGARRKTKHSGTLTANKPPESFNYLTLEDSVITRKTQDDPKEQSGGRSQETGIRRESKGIVKVVHQISKFEPEKDEEEAEEAELTSQLLAREIFSPIVM